MDNKQTESAYVVNAVKIAMSFYDVLSMDPRTAEAAFGVACSELREILNINLTAAIYIIRGELDRRTLEGRKEAAAAAIIEATALLAGPERPPDKT